MNASTISQMAFVIILPIIDALLYSTIAKHSGTGRSVIVTNMQKAQWKDLFSQLFNLLNFVNFDMLLTIC